MLIFAIFPLFFPAVQEVIEIAGLDLNDFE